jgi:3-hydroxybutyryl-CoA dehydratase
MAMKFDSILEGVKSSSKYFISKALYDGFLEHFKDTNPLHVDKKYAARHGFNGEVMHGAILNGFLSHFIGTIFPGKSSVLLSVDIRFLKPNYLEDTLVLHSTVTQIVVTQQAAIVLDFTFDNVTRGYIAARGRAHVKVLSEI